MLVVEEAVDLHKTVRLVVLAVAALEVMVDNQVELMQMEQLELLTLEAVAVALVEMELVDKEVVV